MILEEAISLVRDCYDTCKFQQLSLIPATQFLSHLSRRNLSARTEELERFRDMLVPIQYPPDHAEIHPVQQAQYHPYQVWIVDRIKELHTPNLHWTAWSTASRDWLLKFIDDHRARIDENLAQGRDDATQFYKVLALLSLAEPRYLPDIRGKVSLPSIMESNDAYGEYLDWRRSFSALDALHKAELEPAEVKEWHRRLSTTAHLRKDDAEAWFLLIRHASFDKRDKLKGMLRVAHDYYEMAELLRLLLKDATGEKLPAEDDYQSGGYWKTQVYGVQEINYLDRRVLKQITREFGLDAAYRGYWFVEGDTEAGFFRTFADAEGLTLEHRAIAIINLGGGGDVTERRKEVAGRLRGARQFVELLRRLTADQVFTFLTVDDDPGIEEGLQSLRNQELFSAGFVKWNGDFEEGNFTITELIEVVRRFIGSGTDGEVFTEAEIQAEKSKEDGSGRPKSLGKALADVVRRKRGFEQFSKSEGWGKALAEYALEHPELDGTLRPAIEALDRAQSMSYADFARTVSDLECNATGHLVPRQAEEHN